MSAMKATGGHSAACCNIPPIVSSGYEKKGDYQTLGDRKTYVTGPVDSASKGILVQVVPPFQLHSHRQVTYALPAF